jgi:hypothetical protein
MAGLIPAMNGNTAGRTMPVRQPKGYTMPKFIIEETIPCFVTWRCTIEAADEAEAREMFQNGQHGEKEQAFIGDSIAFLDIELTVKPA